MLAADFYLLAAICYNNNKMYLTPHNKQLDPQGIAKKASPETGGGVSPQNPQKKKKREKPKWNGEMGADWQLVHGGQIDPSKHDIQTLLAKQNKQQANKK